MAETWSLVDFTAPDDIADIVAELLWSMGVAAVEETSRSDGGTTLRTSLGEDPEQQIAAICSRLEGVSARVVKLPRSTADTWRDHATPTFIDDHTAIVPAWIDAPAGIRSILIEPGDTFGMGNHPTTILTVRMAMKHLGEARSVLDLGCGSGVLAVALSMMEGVDCDVFDIADSARSIVRANCELNGVRNVRWNDDYANGTYDMVMANILAPVLRTEAPVIDAVTRPDGIVILSGMRDEQVAGVRESYPNMRRIDEDSIDGWSCLALRKKTG